MRTALLYGLEAVGLKKRQVVEVKDAELRFLLFSLEVTSVQIIINKYNRGNPCLSVWR